MYTWLALGCDVIAFLILLTPGLRRRASMLSVACVLAAGGAYVEKGLGLLIPGMAPDMLGEFYAYRPTLTEVSVGAGIWALGALLFTGMSKIAAAVVLNTMRHPGLATQPAEGRATPSGGWQ
jgi:Ni/Fe-hydrogenase subunit HybB-like protein